MQYTERIVRSTENEDKKKRQFLLRASEDLLDYIEQWAESDFRSINCQIEYLLTECVKREKERKDKA